MINAVVMYEEGFEMAAYGLGKSYGLTSHITYENFLYDFDMQDRLKKIMGKLSGKSGGHNGFLKQMDVWIELTMPRFMWQELVTYRIGVVDSDDYASLSESTMHTLTTHPLTQDDFVYSIDSAYLIKLNALIESKDLEQIKNALPEGFLQTRVIKYSYLALQNIVNQRMNHKLPQWKFFIDALKDLVYPEFIFKESDEANI